MKRAIYLSSALMLAALMLPFATSCGDGTDGWVVQVWRLAEDNLPERKVASGIVVDDGNHVLTVLDYEENIPEELLVVSPKYGRFDATIKAVDYRTSATLLQLQDANLPVAEIGDGPSPGAEQKVSVRGWVGDEYEKIEAKAAFSEDLSPLFFSVQASILNMEGASVIDNNGKVIGLMDGNWSKLIFRSVFSALPAPPGIGIESAMALLTDESHNIGPAVYVILTPSTGRDTVPDTYQIPLNVIKGLDSAVTGLLDELGESLPFDDMPGFLSLHSGDGIMLVTAFTFPVELYGSDGSLLAQARWVGIQWNRDGDKPNRLLYGGSPYEVEGAVSIDGDMGELLQVIQPVIDEFP